MDYRRQGPRRNHGARHAESHPHGQFRQEASAACASSDSDTWLGFTSLLNVSRSFSPHYFSQRFPSFPSATHAGALHPALVRRRTRRLDRLPAVLPGLSAGGLCLCALVGFGREPPFRRACTSMLLASLLFLPIAPRSDLETGIARRSVRPDLDPSDGDRGRSVLLLSATAPLLQRWFTLGDAQKSPWRLYALSNFGSFLALLSYPFVFEPLLRLRTQGWIWSRPYVVFAVVCGCTAWRVAVPPAPEAAPASDTGIRAAPHLRDRAILARALRLRIYAAGVHHQSNLARHRGKPFSVGGGARDLSADVRAGI